MTATFLELGDATSRNLEFSHRDDVSVSFGEETITEINLLEIRRRHPNRVRVRTFPKALEAKTGADWEWLIIGRKLTITMRVQAKRLQCNDVLKIKHKVASTGIQQRQLLIDGAKADKMRPVYCIYCTEKQRGIWKLTSLPAMQEGFQAGCLLADASDVPLTTRKLKEIEEVCIPWHFLFNRLATSYHKLEFIQSTGGKFEDCFISSTLSPNHLNSNEMRQAGHSGWNAPTIDDLNNDTDRDFDRAGVRETTDEDRERLKPETAVGRRIAQYDEARLRERGIHRMMVIDVQEEPVSES